MFEISVLRVYKQGIVFEPKPDNNNPKILILPELYTACK